jgi:hypothetical protein
MNRREIVATSLAACVARLDTVLIPWGFVYRSVGVSASHCGPYALGRYQRGETEIHLSCRDTIDNLVYEHSFVQEYYSGRETLRFSVQHGTLMRAVGHFDDSRLICTNDIPDMIVERHGGDRVAALISDWTVLAAHVLCEPCEEFYSIVRRGHRVYSVG